MWLALRRNTPVAVTSGRWSGSGLISASGALSASARSSLNAVSLSAGLGPLFPGGTDGSPYYAYNHKTKAELKPLPEAFKGKPYLKKLLEKRGG